MVTTAEPLLEMAAVLVRTALVAIGPAAESFSTVDEPLWVPVGEWSVTTTVIGAESDTVVV
jgi:hypothetical protein